MTPILIFEAPENLTDPPSIDLPTPLAIDAYATTLEIDSNVRALEIDGDLEVAFGGVA